VHNILIVSQIILYSCLARKESSRPLHFFKQGSGFEREGKFIVLRKGLTGVETREVPLNYYGDLVENYERHNADYIRRRRHV